MRNRKRGAGGFTLVELIVVIAILAILAGVGTVAYSGYVKYTQKGVDRQTVGELIYAATLADYANPGLFPEGGSAMIVLSEDGTRAAGTSDTAKFAASLSDAVGELNNVKLKYGDWAGAVDGTTLNSMVSSLSGASIGFTDSSGSVLFKDENNENAIVGYAANADEMWEAVEAAAEIAANGTGSTKTPGEYLVTMAQYTVGDGTTVNGASIGTDWSNSGTLMKTNTQDEIILSAGMVIARNFAFAEYLKSNNIQVSDSTLSLLQATPTSINGDDFVNMIMTQPTIAVDKFGNDLTALQQAATDYTTGVYSKGGDTQAYSQAYVDGMIYYALMQNVNDVSSGENPTYDPASDGYMDSIKGYVSVAGKAFSGTTDWNSMVSMANSLDGAGTTVVIYVTKSGDKLTFSVSPADADPRDEAEGESGGGTGATDSAITFTKNLVRVGKNKTYYNSYTINGSGTIQSVMSGDTSVATAEVYTAEGTGSIKVTGVAAGSATVTVTAEVDGQTITGTFNVEVISTSTATIIVTGGTQDSDGKYTGFDSATVVGEVVVASSGSAQIKVFLNSSDGTQIKSGTNGNLSSTSSWNGVSSDKNVAELKVAQGAFGVKGVAEGTTTVTFTIANQTVTVKVTVI